jgi:predicted DNA-binding transcriptional regulator AlpA
MAEGWELASGRQPDGEGWEPYAQDAGVAHWRRPRVRAAGTGPFFVLVTLEQCARWFHVDESTIHRWVKDGVLPEPFRLGRVLRWRMDELQAAIERSRSSPNRATH